MFGLCVECNLFYVLFGECEFDEIFVEGFVGIKIVLVMFGL